MQARGQQKVLAVHVLDGLVLCGMDIRHLHFKERMEKLTKFVRAISRPTRSDLAPIRVKATFRLEHIDRVLAEWASITIYQKLWFLNIFSRNTVYRWSAWRWPVSLCDYVTSVYQLKTAWAAISSQLALSWSKPWERRGWWLPPGGSTLVFTSTTQKRGRAHLRSHPIPKHHMSKSFINYTNSIHVI